VIPDGSHPAFTGAMRRRLNLNRLPGMLGLGLALVVALTPTHALAQGRAPQGAAAPPKEAPPLFPRHRRGIYRNSEGNEVVDATPQSPPLEIDDPGVPDKGEYEINLTTRADLSKDEKTVDLLHVDANYGIRPKIAGYELPTQVKFEVPVTAAREGESPYTRGVGAAKFGLKFNFYRNENSGLSVAFYPQIEFEAPGTNSIEKGLAEPGQTLTLPMLVAKEFHYFTLVANGAVNKPLHAADRETTATFAAGFGRAFTRKVAAMIELRNESALDFKTNHLMFLDFGLIHGVRNVIVYTRLGHSLFSDDGSGHTYVGVGLKFVIHPHEP
jgi:hypothetical protein